MINVSQDYLDNIYDDETKTYCTASFGAYDLTAKESANVSATSQKFGVGGWKKFNASIAPTSWNSVTDYTSYSSTNYYGNWSVLVEGQSTGLSQYRASYGADGDNSTAWRCSFSSSSKTAKTFTLEFPFAIRPQVMHFSHSRTSGSSITVKIQGYSTAWEDLGSIATTSSEFTYNGTNTFTKIRLVVEDNGTVISTEYYYLYNFEVTTGFYKTMAPQDSIDGVIGDPTNGWTSQEVSNSNGTFATNPIITYLWNESHSSPGLQLYFTNPVKSATITYYNGTTVIDTYSISGNDSTYEIENPVNNYNKMTIEFIEVSPNRPVEMQEANFGLEYTWNDEIIKIEVEEVLDNKMQELPSGKASITLNNTTNQFNKYDPSSLLQFLQEGQRVQINNIALINGVPETVPLGVFYLSSWRNDTEYTVQFDFNDLLLRLANREYKRSKFYSNDTAQTVIEDMMNDFNLTYDSSIQYEIDSTIASETLTGYLEVEDFRTALQKLCIALRAVAYSNREGKIVIKRISSGTYVDTIDYTKKQYSIGENQEVFDRVTVQRMHSFGYSGDEKTLFSGSLSGDTTITFETPANNVSVSGSMTSYTIYANCVDIVGASGTVTITGRPLTTFKQPVTVQNSNVTGATALELNVPEIPIVDTVTQAQDIGNWLLGELQKNIKNEFRWLGNPAIEIGDIVTIQVDEELSKTALIVKNKFTYNGALSETSTVVM